ncbi:DUF2254 domain-containing protein [Pseudalkalibacillus hwajinpoensis]|uniref:DUF2254 domain-containing protein n=1 Tax=Guptibacillus hwajinpoensis TaxID=208199 RepID=UPI001CD25895|nr:DUF2254 domain-containing protein [Pseudalkalibacillus hwajinpoensis]MCA0991999.1 DUF2254 domain-containing protein [Pseudalkalibacillus hwajinpoensis]
MNYSKTSINLRNSFWFLPVVYGLISLAVVGLTTWIDIMYVSQLQGTLPKLFLATEKLAQSLYAPLVTAILTMTTISFSSIMVVLTTYSSQFSPRTLQDFISDRFTQHVLGVFVAGFVFALVNMLLLTGKDSRIILSPLLTVILAITCLLFFILFIHHSATFVQVNNLIEKITRRSLYLVEKKSELYEGETFEKWDRWEESELREEDGIPIYSHKMGYIQQIPYSKLVDLATQNESIIRLNSDVGNYVKEGSRIATVWMKDSSTFSTDNFLNSIAIGTERINDQDLEFSIQKLVDIALRAISPSVNDPHTAVNCTNRIGTILSKIGHSYDPKEAFFDKERNLRVLSTPKPFFQYLYKSFYQIRHYGKDDVSMLNGILDALILTADGQRKEIKADVQRFHQYLLTSIDLNELPDLDREFLLHTSEVLNDVCK